MDQALDCRTLPVEVLLFVADLSDGAPCHFDQSFAGDRSRTAHFAGQHHAVRCDQRLDAATRLRFGGKKGIDDRIGDAVANLVGMTFRHRFAGEHKIAARQVCAFPC